MGPPTGGHEIVDPARLTPADLGYAGDPYPGYPDPGYPGVLAPVHHRLGAAVPYADDRFGGPPVDRYEPYRGEPFRAEPYRGDLFRGPPVDVEPEPALAPGWAPGALVVAGIVAVWAALLWASQNLTVQPTLHTGALFVHLVSLVVGFGAVLFIDFHGLQWVFGRRRLSEISRSAHIAHQLIWGGFIGLVASGIMLEPDLSVPQTRVKMVAVLVVALNGLNAGRVQKQMEALGDRTPPASLLRRSVTAVAVSQVAWWGAVIIGYLNSAGRANLL